MNRMQKISWLNIICCGTAVILSSMSIAILYVIFGFPVASAGFGFLGFIGFTGLGPLIFKKDPGPVQADERDRLINSKAARVGFGSAYMVLIIMCMGLWEYCRFFKGIKMISIDVLPMLVWPPAIALLLGHATTLLILYGKDHKLSEGGAV